MTHDCQASTDVTWLTAHSKPFTTRPQRTLKKTHTQLTASVRRYRTPHSRTNIVSWQAQCVDRQKTTLLSAFATLRRMAGQWTGTICKEEELSRHKSTRPEEVRKIVSRVHPITRPRLGPRTCQIWSIDVNHLIAKFVVSVFGQLNAYQPPNWHFTPRS
jgi:hypothetical protein